MDVTCQRCGTEYEFDETLVSDRGTTVKCTNCGHLFKVFRPGSEAAAALGEQRAWTVRHRDGRMRTLGSLRELQRLITTGDLKEDDDISRSGEAWKRLGDIAELQTFFAAARAARGSAPEPAAPVRRDPTPIGIGPAAPYQTAPSTRPAAKGTIRGSAPPAADVPPAPTRGTGTAPLSQPPAAGPPRPAKRTLIGGGFVAPAVPPGSMPAPAASPAPASSPPAAAPAAAPARAPSERPAPAAAMSMAATSRKEPSSPPPAAAIGATVSSIGSAPTIADIHTAGVASPASAAAAAAPDSLATAHERPGPRPQTVPKPVSDRPRAPRSSEVLVEAGGAAPQSTRPPQIDDGDEPARIPKKRGSIGMWITLLVVFVALGGGAALAWPQLAPMLGLAEAEDPIGPFLERAQASLAQDHDDGYAAAEREYVRATALAERDPRVLAGLALVHAVWAQALDFEADDLEARATTDPSFAGAAARLRAEQRRHADEARRNAEDAVRQNPANVDGEIALSEALRLTGDRPGARRHLDRAREMQRDPSAELLRVGALLAMDEADGRLAAARDGAQRAVEKAPDMIRARLLLARVLLSEGDVAAARAQITEILRRVPSHPSATALDTAIREGLPPASPVVAVLDAGLPVDAGVAVQPTPPEQAGTTQQGGATATQQGGGTTTQQGGGGAATPPAGRDPYDWYCERGNERLDRGDSANARRFFQQALAVRDGAEARTGMGFVELDMNRASAAADHFRRASAAGYAEAFIGLGTAYREMGRLEEAIRAYESYIERAPGGSQAGIARAQISALREQVAARGGGGAGAGGTPPPDNSGGGSDTPPTPPDQLPAPRGTDPANPPPSSDAPAVGSEP